MKRFIVAAAMSVALFGAVGSSTAHATDDGWSCEGGSTKYDNLSGPTYTVRNDSSEVWIKAGPNHYSFGPRRAGAVLEVKATTGSDTSHAHECDPPSTTTTSTTTTSTTSTTSTTTTTTEPEQTTTTRPRIDCCVTINSFPTPDTVSETTTTTTIAVVVDQTDPPVTTTPSTDPPPTDSPVREPQKLPATGNEAWIMLVIAGLATLGGSVLMLVRRA